MARGHQARAIATVGVWVVLSAAILATGCGDGAQAGTSGKTCDAEESEMGYILPTAEALQQTLDGLDEGPFFMLNLLRLREVPDYSQSPERAPETPITAREAFDQFAEIMDAELTKVGAEIVFRAEGGAPLIGPPDERWDIVQIAYYPSRQSFLDFAGREVVLEHTPDRFAILEDSRILPVNGRLFALAD